MRENYTLNNSNELLSRNDVGVSKSNITFLKSVIASICFVGALLFAGNANAQCSNYLVYEGIGTSIPTGGGVWADNSVTYSPLATALSGTNVVVLNAINDFIRTPQIANPGIFTFSYKRNTFSTATTWEVQTSPDGLAPWTVRNTISTFTTAWQVSTTDLSAFSNVYVRIFCSAGTQPRYIDDIGWTTSTISSPTLNTLIPGIDAVATTSCSQTITCGTTYSFMDEGGLTDGYVNLKTNTITFTPSVGTSKVQLAFSAFDTENGMDGMMIYNGPTTGSPIFPSGLGVGTNATNCPANSFYGSTSPGTLTSTDASGAITIVFRSDVTYSANAGWLVSVTCVAPPACQVPSLLATTSITSNSATINWTDTSPSNGYQYVVSLSNTVPAGAGTPEATTSVNLSGLLVNTQYYVFVRSDCGGSGFSTWTPVGTFTTLLTPCVAPAQATGYAPATATSSTLPTNFTSSSATGYLVIQSTTPTAPAQPVSGVTYNAGNITSLGAGLTFVQSSASTVFSGSALAGNTQYYFFIYAYNNTSCSGGPMYNTSGPLTGNGITCPAVPNTVATAGITGGGFTLNWTAPTGGSASAITYSVQVTTDAGYTANIAGSPFSVAAPTVTLNITGLSPTTVYYYRIRAGNGCNSAYVTGSVTTTNYDDCSSATTLTVNGSPTCSVSTSATTVGATQSQVGCAGTADDDVWFKFTATGTSHLVTVTPNTLSDAVFQLFSGTCASLVSFGCIDGTIGSSVEAATLTGLTIGSTYYIRVYSYANGASQGTFTICLTTPPPPPTNGACAGATSLPCGTSNLAGTTVGTTNTPHGTACGMSNYGVWYTFVGDGQQTTITSTATGGFDHEMSISSGTCGSFTAITCQDVGFTNGSETYTFNTATGVNYYVYIAGWLSGGTTTGTFTISRTCAAAGTPPSNNLCTASTSLPCGTSSLVGTTVNTANVAHGTACSMSNYGVWYSFTGDGNQTTISSTATGGFDHEMSISSGSCGAFTSLACQDAAFTNGTETYTFTTVAGVNYYIYIAHYLTGGSTTGTFVISRTCSTPPPPLTNDECTSAIALTVDPSCTYSYFTNAGATGSIGVPAPGCANYAGGDVWFSVVVPANGILHIDTETGVVTDGGMAAYSGACGSLALIACNDDSSSNGLMPYLSLTGLTPGQTIYIRFWEYGNDNTGTFGICITAPTSCTTGPGTGVTTLGCPSVVSGGLSLSGADPAPVNACVGSTCVDLEATYLQLGQTTNYTVSSIPYSPPYQYGCLQNPVSVNVDDIWSPIITLPFNFCFYGINYNQCLIGSNGVLSFDLAGNTPGGFNAWSFSNNVPNPALVRNTIFGVYHDIDPSKGGEVGYELITLNSGCRALVAAWTDVPMFSDNSILYTGMMVLYEDTNIIEVYIKEKKIDNNNVAPWNSGNAIVGIQDAAGTSGMAAPNRNGLDANWIATDEAWRFTPSGASITSLKWYLGPTATGPVIGTTSPLNVCPSSTTTYTAEVSYTLCSGVTLKKTDQTTVTVNNGKTWNGSVSTAWDTDANWTPVGKPIGTDCVTIPITTRNPIISGSGYNGLAGTLSILNGAVLTVNSGNNITVTDWVNVQATGSFVIENNSSLVQINNVANTGNIIYKRDASIRRLDYVYWSSPVANFNVNNISSPIAPGPIYTWNTTVANPNGGQGNWQSAAGQVMQRGIGYIVRGPDTFTTTPATLNGVFTGVPHNGSFTAPIARGSDQNTALHYGTNGTQITNYSDNYNLLGNPYPSALRGSQFLVDNQTKLEGNIKLWTHGALPAVITSPFYNSFLYNYSLGDYLTWNFTGTVCCPAAASDLFIGAGQGFVVQMQDGPAATNTVDFNNTMRSASFNNSLFYRTISHTTPPPPSNISDLERHRIWLDVIDSNNLSDRALVGYIEGASMNRDSFFDANALITGAMTIYSLLGTEAFTIQGRTLPFNQDDTVPLGLMLPVSGAYKIGIAALDGLFTDTSQNIFLEDVEMGVIHNLRQQPYSFNASAGTYNNRFVLRYTDGSLGTNNPVGSGLSVYIHNQMLFASASQNIESIQLFDVSGKLIRSYGPKEKSHHFSEDFVFPNGVYFAKIKLENGIMFTRKLMN